MKFQQKLVEKLNSEEPTAYKDSAIYTVLLDLVQNNNVEDIFIVLHDVATDLGKRKELEQLFEEVKNYT